MVFLFFRLPTPGRYVSTRIGVHSKDTHITINVIANELGNSHTNFTVANNADVCFCVRGFGCNSYLFNRRVSYYCLMTLRTLKIRFLRNQLCNAKSAVVIQIRYTNGTFFI